MYLIAAWVFPAGPELSRERIAWAVDREISQTRVAHVFLCERDDWLIIGLFLNGASSRAPDRDVERVRVALASVVRRGEATTILVERMPLEPLADRTPWPWDG
ncbi:hypothetical protein [Actinoplanes sp. NPDC051859]|uniref:hypothetical protein n=1 Tax=Actinoplanes sp. NPDC051859 TaxID=3363909 RepID=UPI0037A547F6